MEPKYSQTQFLDNISKLDSNDIFTENKSVLELIEFVIEEQSITDEIIDRLDMAVIDEAINMINNYNTVDATPDSSINLLNEMMYVFQAKSVLLNLKPQRNVADTDFF